MVMALVGCLHMFSEAMVAYAQKSQLNDLRIVRGTKAVYCLRKIQPTRRFMRLSSDLLLGL